MKSSARLLALILIGAFSLQSAESAVSAEVTESVNMDIKTVDGAAPTIDDAFEAYRKSRGIAAYGTADAKGTVYITGSAPVVANVNNPGFIKSRAIAYDKAYLNAIAEFVMDLVGQETTRQVAEYFSDQSDNRYDPPADMQQLATGLAAKMEKLAETQVDQGLKAAGVDPAKYDAMPLQQKRTLLKNSIINISTKKAFHDCRGFLPVNTFECRASDGNYTIGVVVRCDAICTEIARCLHNKQRPTISKARGISAEQALPSSNELLCQQLGVRLFFNEKGTPTLLSFGQWGSSSTSTSSKERNRAMDHAFKQAQAMADQQLTTFINSSASLYECSERGELEQEHISFTKDSSAKAESVAGIIDRFSKKSSVVASDSLPGRSTVKRIKLKHPSGHDVACVVRMWSFDTLDAGRAILEGKAPEPPQQPAPAVQQEDAGVRQGRTYDF